MLLCLCKNIFQCVSCLSLRGSDCSRRIKNVSDASGLQGVIRLSAECMFGFIPLACDGPFDPLSHQHLLSSIDYVIVLVLNSFFCSNAPYLFFHYAALRSRTHSASPAHFAVSLSLSLSGDAAVHCTLCPAAEGTLAHLADCTQGLSGPRSPASRQLGALAGTCCGSALQAED